MASLDYRPARDLTELERYADLIDASFRFPPADFLRRFEQIGVDGFRVADVDRWPAATLVQIPMGHWLGGQSVSMTGIALVATAPEYRGRGIATQLMERCVQEMHEDGAALSSLFPASIALYRRAGYELAGRWYKLKLSLRELRFRDKDPELEIRPVLDEDWPKLHAAYAEFARRHHGALDRGPYQWFRVRNPIEGTVRAYQVLRDGKVEGYVVYTLTDSESFGYDLYVADLVALSPAAGKALLTLLCDHKTLGDKCVWQARPDHPLLSLFPDHGWEIIEYVPWMTRMLNVQKALEQRGYPKGMEAELHLRLSDPLLPANEGDYVLQVSGGRGTVQRGGRGDLECTVPHFTSIYTGYYSAHAAHSIGWCSGSEEALDTADAIFGSQTPWLSNMF